MKNVCLYGDCRQSLKQISAAGIRAQTCVTSPPYWNLRDYGHKGQIGLERNPMRYLAAMRSVFRLVRDCLADDGTLWLNIGDSYNGSGKGGGVTRMQKTNPASFGMAGTAARGVKDKDMMGIPWLLALILRNDGWYLRSDIIWSKPNPMPESVKDRPTRSHEYIFLFAKSKRYYYDHEAIREPATEATIARMDQNIIDQAGSDRQPGRAGRPMKAVIYKKPSGWNTGKGDHRDKTGRYSARPDDLDHGQRENLKQRQHGERYAGFNERWDQLTKQEQTDIGRNKRDVWTVPTEGYADAHFATFPSRLIEPCILAGSRPGDMVLDPFLGSGTTAQVAEKLGRLWIGCELNPDYKVLIDGRTQQTAMQI